MARHRAQWEREVKSLRTKPEIVTVKPENETLSLEGETLNCGEESARSDTETLRAPDIIIEDSEEDEMPIWL